MIDLPKRKDLRLRDWNYSTPGAYFITICTQEKRCILSEILPVGAGVLDRPNLKLTEMGKQVEEILLEMNKKTSGIDVNQYVIMPNHIHMLIVVSPPPETERDKTARVSYFGTSQAPYPTENNDLKITLRGNGNRANEIIPKFISLFKRYCNHEIGHNIWQRRYYDHVIRSYREYENAYRYIDNNPAQWAEDEYY